MAVKIRLTRTGRHKDAHYRIVVADSRCARDARIIEQIGCFDPDKDLEGALIDEEKALAWLSKGAQLSDTVRSLFRKKGIIRKHVEAKGQTK